MICFVTQYCIDGYAILWHIKYNHHKTLTIIKLINIFTTQIWNEIEELFKIVLPVYLIVRTTCFHRRVISQVYLLSLLFINQK